MHHHALHPCTQYLTSSTCRTMHAASCAACPGMPVLYVYPCTLHRVLIRLQQIPCSRLDVGPCCEDVEARDEQNSWPLSTSRTSRSRPARRFSFNISAHADGEPRTRVDLELSQDASYRDLSDATLLFDLAPGVRRRHPPKICPKKIVLSVEV